MAGKVRAVVITDLLKSWHEFQHASLPTSSCKRYLRSDLVILAITTRHISLHTFAS